MTPFYISIFLMCDFLGSPNVVYTNIGSLILFHTTKDVKAGEELCISYIESKCLLDSPIFRNDNLQRDFFCNCSRCADLTENDKQILKNTEILDERICEVK